jgi:hypothetical protein
MSYIAEVPASQKTAYKRPYKTRNQRRVSDRNKYDESRDRKFLWWMAGAVVVLLVIVVGFMAQGMMERSAIEAAAMPTTGR